MMQPALGETIYLGFKTEDAGGTLADADSTPTVIVFENGGNATLSGASVTKRTGLDGKYYATVACTSGNGFEAGKSYEVEVTAVVDGITCVETIEQFQVRTNSVDSAVTVGTNNDKTGYALADADVGTAADRVLLALPNAAHSAANGLPTNGTGTGQISLTSGRTSATLANGVAHGGSTATLRLGTAGTDPALWVTSSGGPAARIESTLTGSGGTGSGLEIICSDDSAAALLCNANDGVGVFLSGNQLGVYVYNPVGGSSIRFDGAATFTNGITANVTGNVTGNLSGSVGSISGLTVANVEHMATRFLGMIEVDGGVYRFTTNAMEQGPAGPTAAAVADAVWDEALSGHQTNGSAGKALTDSSGNMGSGADEVTLTFTKEGGAPIADADVWITNDAAGDNVVAGTLQTDSQGEVTFLLDDGATYYSWLQKDGVNSILGQQFVAEADA